MRQKVTVSMNIYMTKDMRIKQIRFCFFTSKKTADKPEKMLVSMTKDVLQKNP
jgi:hypothetical protein